MSHAGSGYGMSSHCISDRLLRQMCVLTFFTLTEDGMHSLYGRALQTWLEEFPSYAVEHHYEFAKVGVISLCDASTLLAFTVKI